MKLLVEWQESREVLDFEMDVVHIDEGFKNRVIEALQIPAVNQTLILQQWDVNWNTHVNLKNGAPVLDGMALKCVLKQGEQEQDGYANSAVLDAVQVAAIPPAVAEQGSSVRWSQHNSETLLKQVEQRLSTLTKKTLANGSDLSWTAKHELIQTLSDTLYKIDTNPTRQAKEGLAKALVTRFPKLKNRLGSPHSAWLEKLNNGLKALRAKDPEHKSPNRKKRNATGPCEDEPLVKRGEVSWQPPLPHTDEVLLIQQKEVLKREHTKKEGCKDLGKIKELMTQTYGHRREFINGEPDVREVMEAYPALFTIPEITHEFQQLMHIDLDEVFLGKYPTTAAKLVLHASNIKRKSGDIDIILAKHAE